MLIDTDNLIKDLQFWAPNSSYSYSALARASDNINKSQLVDKSKGTENKETFLKEDFISICCGPPRDQWGRRWICKQETSMIPASDCESLFELLRIVGHYLWFFVLFQLWLIIILTSMRLVSSCGAKRETSLSQAHYTGADYRLARYKETEV